MPFIPDDNFVPEELPVIQPAQQSQEKSFGDKLRGVGEGLGSFFGGNKIGEALHNFRASRTPEAQDLKKNAPDLYEKIFAGPSAGEIAGDAGQIGLSLAGLKGFGTAGKLGSRLLKTAALGSGFGISEALKEKSTDKIFQKAATGATLGATLGVGGEGLSALGRRLTIDTPKQLVNMALKIPAKKIPQNTSEAFLKRRLGGKSLESIIEITNKEINSVDAVLEKKLKKSTQTFSIPKMIAETAERINEKTGAKLTTASLKERLASFIPDHAYILNRKLATASETNLLRKALDRNLKENAFLGKPLKNEEKAVFNFTNSTRASLQKNTNTRSIFKTLSEATRINKLANEASNKAQTGGRPGLLDATALGAGALLGGPTGAVAGVVGERVVRSPIFQGGLAQALQSAGKLEPLLKSLSPLARTEVLKVLTSL